MGPPGTPSVPVAVLGATGYIGNRLVGELLRQGHRVRALARSPARLAGYAWAGHERLETAQCDVDDQGSIRQALRGCSAAYYLVHRMQAGVRDFATQDRRAAQNFVTAVDATPGLQQILYLGGLGVGQPSLSRHLRSRHEVEHILQSSRVPVTVLRAAMVIGAGSASFEILRYLTDRLPVMVAPKWLYVPCQPIFIADVVGYLSGCLGRQATMGQSFDIGGPSVLSYRQLMDLTAQASGVRKRHVLPIPVLTPRLSSYWVGVVTPIAPAIARPLAEGLRNRVVCRENRIRDIVPRALVPMGHAIRLSVSARAAPAAPVHAPQPGDPRWAGGTVFIDQRECFVAAPPDRVWATLSDLGGSSGWPGANPFWRLRAMLNRLHGGPGLRGASGNLRPDEVLDFWRIAQASPPRLLRLRAELIMPGQGTLEFRLTREGAGTRLIQRAEFWPRGLAGIVYWQTLRPFHALVFGRLIGGLQRRGAGARKAALDTVR